MPSTTPDLRISTARDSLAPGAGGAKSGSGRGGLSALRSLLLSALNGAAGLGAGVGHMASKEPVARRGGGSSAAAARDGRGGGGRSAPVSAGWSGLRNPGALVAS